MPWEVPITVGDQTYPVQFNTESEPTQADIDEAVAQILQTDYGVKAPAEDTGQSRFLSGLSSIGRGALSVIPGAVGGVGYLTEPVIGPGLKEFGEDIESGIEKVLPVNPAYEEEFSQKAAGAIGQAGGMLLTGGVAGALGKGAAAARGLGAAEAAAAGTRLAGKTLLGSGFLSGSREGGQAAERYGMEGVSAYTRALLGGAIEGATEKYLFGLGTELAPVKKFLGDTLEKGVGGIAKMGATEAGEEAAAQVAGNIATKVLAPEGVETPGIGSGVGEAAALGGVAGLALGGVTGLLPSGEKAEPATAAESVTVESGEMPLPAVLKTLDEKVKAAVEANADVLPATAAALKETAPEPVVEETVVAEAPAAPAAPVIEEAVVTETPAQEESPAAPPAEPTDATEGQTPTPGGVGAPPVVTNEPQTPSPAEQPVSAAETPVATEPEAPLPETEKVVAPKEELEQGAGMTQRDTSKPEQIVSERKAEATKKVFESIQKALSSGNEFQIPGNPPLRITSKNKDQFSLNNRGELVFTRGRKGGVISIDDVAAIGAQVGTPFDLLSLYENLPEQETIKESDALAVAQSDGGIAFERLKESLGDVNKAVQEIETSTGMDVFSVWPVVIDAVADSTGISKGLWVDTEAKAARLRSLYKEASEMPESKERADAIEQILMAFNINQSNRDSIKRKRILRPEAPPTQTETQPEPEDASKNQVEETGGTPPVESQPPQTRPEGEAQEGASQRGREGEEGVLTPEKAAPGVEPGAAALSRGKPREAIVFNKPVKTPLGDVIGYSWSSQLVEDVDKDGEPILRRVSNWDEAATNAETGRGIVHRFQIRKPDGSVSEVSLESTMGALSTDMKKTVKAVISAARRIPFMKAELAELEAKKAQADKEYQELRSAKPSFDSLKVEEPDSPSLVKQGKKRVTLDGVFVQIAEKNELTPSGELINPRRVFEDNLWQWRSAKQKTKLTGTESERIDSLKRRIKKAEALLKSESIGSQKASFEETTSLAETGSPVAEMKPPSVTTDRPAPLSKRPSLGDTGKQIISAWRNLQGVKVAPGETVVGWDVNGGGTYAFIGDRLVRLQRNSKGFESTYMEATGKGWQDVSDSLDRGAFQIEVRKITGLGNYPKVDAGRTVKVLHQATGKPLQEFLDTPEGRAYEDRIQKAVAERNTAIEFGSTNTIFTKEKAEEASKIIKRKLGQTNVPAFDPELFAAATNYAGFLIEGGVRKFGDFSSRMISEFGETVRPILKSVYSGIRELDIIEGLDDAATVSKVLAGEAPAPAPAPAPVKAQPKAPTEPAETPEQVGIANAAVDVAREAIGLPPIERPVQEVYGDDQMWADAEAAMAADPDRGRYLVKSLIENPSSASPLDTAILLRETVARTARLQQASIELVNATPENKESARQKYDDAVMALTEVQESSALAGAEQGRAFRARRFLADLNYNLAAMTTTLQGAHQRKLTDAEVAEVMAQSEKINKALKEVNDLKDSAGAVAEEESLFAEVVKEAQAEARLNAKEAISTAKSEIKSGRSVMDVINEKRDAARARLRKRGGSLNVGLNPADLVDYAIIAASYIAEGAVTLKDVTVKMVKEFGAAIEQHMPKIFSEAQVLKSELDNVAVEEPSEAAEKPKGKKPAIEQLREDGEISGRLVYEMVKEKVKSGLTTLDEVFKAVTADVQTVVPEITERELRDLFSGYGKVKFPSQEELPKKVRELRRLAQLASAIEDAQNKIAPLRSGPQRDEASLAVREAQKELHRIMKEQGIQRAPGPRALKSALDAAKTRLRNQIEDLEKQIKERKRVPADKRDIVYDQETKDLIAKRDELQATLEEIDPPQPPTAQELIKKALKELDKTIAELEKKVKERDISKPATTETPITEQIQVKRDQRDALRRQLKDIRIEIEGEPYLTQEQVNERAERNLTRQIDELQRQIDEKDFEQSQGQKPENTAAIIRLKARRDTLREQRDILREQTLGKKVKSEAERIDIAVKALEKSIDSLNERIRKGEVMPKAREDKTPQVAKVRNLRAERDSLRSVLTQMRKAQEEAAKDPEAEQLRRDRQYLESQIKNYQKKLASGDFRPQPKKAKEYSNKLAAKTLELQKLKEEWAEKVFIAQLNSRGKGAKAYDFGKQVLHTSRSVLTSFDVSAVFRQGGFIALGNPIRAFRNLKPMFESLASERAAQRTKDELESRPNFKLYQQSKLYLADFNQLAMNQQEEAFMSRWLNKIPKALGGGIIRGSQRAYVTFLNRLRADTFDAMLGSLQKGPEPTTEEIKAIADYINIATGRGALGKFQQAGEALNTVFFAPRLVASRFQILGGYPYFKASGRTKNLVLREYAKFLTGAALVYALGMALQDEEDKAVEIDPRSSDFLKLRYGDTRVDPLGGLIQATVFLSRIVSGEKKQLSGKVVPIRDSYRLMNLFRESPRKDKVRYGADNTFDVGANFLRSKFSPSFGAAVDILTGETVVGEKTTPTEVGYKMVMPITFGEAKETLESHGMPAGPALTIVSLFGMGVQTYD